MTTTPWDTRRDAPDVPEERRPPPTYVQEAAGSAFVWTVHPAAVRRHPDAFPVSVRLALQQQDAHDWLRSMDRLPSLDDERSLVVVP